MEEIIGLIESQLNQLLCDEEISGRRNAAVNWVDARLEPAVQRRMAALAMREQEMEDFAVGKKPACEAVREKLAGAGLSRSQCKRIRYIAAVDPEAALVEIRRLFLEQERLRVRDSAEIPHTSWFAFINARGYVTEETAARISAALGGGKREAEELISLLPRSHFENLGKLRELLEQLMRERQLSVAELQERTLLSGTAWEPFRKNSEKGASQAALLRLALGLELDRPGAEKLLKAAGSGFILRRDLVVLCALMDRIYDAGQVYEILEQFAYDSQGRRYYGNIYQDRVINA